MVESINPPRWILFILWPFKGEFCYPQIVGDLNEEYHQRIAENGRSVARRWYYREVFRNLISMTLRWITIPVIIIPLLWIVLSDSLQFRLFIKSIIPYWWGFLWTKFVHLLIASTFGLSLGIICSQILRGHGRMVRVAFGVIYLGYTAYYLPVIVYLISSNMVPFYKPEMIVSLVEHYILHSLCTLTFVWIGSIWNERHHNRRRAA